MSHVDRPAIVCGEPWAPPRGRTSPHTLSAACPWCRRSHRFVGEGKTFPPCRRGFVVVLARPRFLRLKARRAALAAARRIAS